MPSLEAAVHVARPSASVFAWIAEPARRQLLLPDNFRDFRIREDSGRGAHTTFTIVTPQGEFASEVVVEDWDPPDGLTERTTGADGYTIRWRFAPEADGCRVTAVMNYRASGNFLYRLADRWLARRTLQSSLQVELNRLKIRAEAEES